LIQAFVSSIRTLSGEVAILKEAASRSAAAKVETRESLAALSEGLFAVSCIDGQEQLVELAPTGHTRLGYGSANTSGGHADTGIQKTEPLFRTRHRLYLPLLAHRARVLDIGCGRGGMLDLLRVAKIHAVGIDRDPEMVRHCRANGHTVELADPLPFLRAQPGGSVGAIFSARLVERLPFEELQEFFRLCRDRLERGGLLIAEAASPHRRAGFETPIALAPSARAIRPQVALTLCQLAGFEEARVLFLGGAGDLDADRQARAPYAVVATASMHD
jgi:SAM-dependent methyltransferase